MRFRLMLCATLIVIVSWPHAVEAGPAFRESWTRAKLKAFKPRETLDSGRLPTIVRGTAGRWILNGTVAEYEEDCGATPHRATILRRVGNKMLRLTSGVSVGGGCSDNVWIEWRKDLNKRRRDIAIEPGTMISFTAAGGLDDPLRTSTSCGSPPCGDHVAIVVVDSRRTGVAYLLARHPEREPDERDGYREIFLDPAGGPTARSLYDDFAALPGFRAGSTVQFVILQIDEHGWMEIDDLVIGSGLP